MSSATPRSSGRRLGVTVKRGCSRTGSCARAETRFVRANHKSLTANGLWVVDNVVRCRSNRSAASKRGGWAAGTVARHGEPVVDPRLVAAATTGSTTPPVLISRAGASGGDDRACGAVGRVGLRPVGDYPVRVERRQLGQPLGRGREDPDVGVDHHRVATAAGQLDRHHPSTLELAVLGERRLVLLVAEQGDGVAFLAGDALLGRRPCSAVADHRPRPPRGRGRSCPSPSPRCPACPRAPDGAG